MKSNTFLLKQLDRKAYFLLLNVLFTNIGLGGHSLMTGILIYNVTGSVVAFATTLSLGFALDLVGQFFGGGILDRISPRSTANFVNISRGLLIIIAGILVIVTQSIVGVIIVSLYMSIMGPAYRASIFSLSPLLIQQELLSRYNALRMGVMQAGQLLGLGMSTLILAMANKEIAFIFLGIWFLLGGLMTFSLGKLPSREKTIHSKVFNFTQTLLEWKELLVAFRTTPSIYAHVLISSSGLLISAIINLLIVPLNESLKGQSLGYVILDGGYIVGAFLASYLLSRIVRLERFSRYIVNISLWLSTGAIFLVGAGNIYFAGFWLFVIGFSSTSAVICLDTSLQLRVGSNYLGRTAIFQDVFMSLVAVFLVPIIANTIEAQGIQSSLNLTSLVLFIYAGFTLLCGSSFLFGKRMFEKSIQL